MEGGRWKDSSLGNGHREDHPDEEAADDVLQSLAYDNDDVAKGIDHNCSFTFTITFTK